MLNALYHTAEIAGFAVCAYGLAQVWIMNNSQENAQ